jgi:AraC-like DNA-binding protein
MLVTSVEEFQKEIFKQLSFTPNVMENYTLYKSPEHPENGYCIHFHRPGYYEFSIADYTIPNNFDITFNNPSTMLRFGTVYEGVTKYRLAQQPISSFSPSSFLVFEKDLLGRQVWIQGQHFHGAEITIHNAYFEEVVFTSFPNVIDFNQILFNYTYRSLPIEIISIIQKLQGLAFNNTLTPIYLESKILECIAILANDFNPSIEYTFTKQLHNSTILIGKNRKVNLTSTDINSIKRAYELLTDTPFNPPTIEALSKLVLLNQQKLKAGFQLYYHQSIGKYTNTLRMATAANLLLTTDLSIEIIGQKIGYNYSANFTKMFKKTYGITALQYRKKARTS